MLAMVSTMSEATSPPRRAATAASCESVLALMHVVDILASSRGAQLLHAGSGFGQSGGLLFGTCRKVVVATTNLARAVRM
ncbi:MAG: hypothetical protein ACR5LD_05505 [Symbiopectobacterium sp.]